MFIINKEKSQNLGPPDTSLIAVDDDDVDKDGILEDILHETDEEGTFELNCIFLFQKIPILAM